MSRHSGQPLRHRPWGRVSKGQRWFPSEVGRDSSLRSEWQEGAAGSLIQQEVILLFRFLLSWPESSKDQPKEHDVT